MKILRIVISSYAIAGGVIFLACSTARNWNTPIAETPELPVVFLLIAVVLNQSKW